MLFNGRALIFTFSGTQVRIAEIERLQSLFKTSMAIRNRNSLVPPDIVLVSDKRTTAVSDAVFASARCGFVQRQALQQARVMTALVTTMAFRKMITLPIRGGTIHRCIDISRYFSRDTYRDIIFYNRNFFVIYLFNLIFFSPQ